MTFPEFFFYPTPKLLERYKDIMVTTVKSLEAWKNDRIIEEDMTQVLENEWKLAKISEKYEYYYDEDTEEITLDQLNELTEDPDYPFNWIDYVNNVMDNQDVTVDGSQVVLIPGRDLIQEMFMEIVRIPKREQENLLFWRIFSKFAANFFKTGKEEEGEIYKSIFDTKGGGTDRSENCINQIKKFFPNILDDLIVTKYLPKEEKNKIRQKFKQVKEEFKDIINNKEWLSKRDKIKAKQKLKRMRISVGKIHKEIDYYSKMEYSQEMEYLKQLKKDAYVTNLVTLSRSLWKNRVKNFREEKDDVTGEWREAALYRSESNRVHILVGVIKGNSSLLSPNIPLPMVYGGLTSIVGHEMIHGFDSENIENRLDQESKNEFEKKVDCMVEQYNNFKFKVDGKSYNVDGKLTKDENICDNGGVNTAYRYHMLPNSSP